MQVAQKELRLKCRSLAEVRDLETIVMSCLHCARRGLRKRLQRELGADVSLWVRPSVSRTGTSWTNGRLEGDVGLDAGRRSAGP